MTVCRAMAEWWQPQGAAAGKQRECKVKRLWQILYSSMQGHSCSSNEFSTLPHLVYRCCLLLLPPAPRAAASPTASLSRLSYCTGSEAVQQLHDLIVCGVSRRSSTRSSCRGG